MGRGPEERIMLRERWEKLRNRPGLFKFFLVFAGLAAAILCHAVFYLFGSLGALGWPSVEGTITKSELAFTESSSNSSSTAAYADVLYTYEVDGQRYSGSDIDCEVWMASEDTARSQVSEYEKGPVQVYYDPDEPSEAVLAPGIPWRSLVLSVLIALACGAVGFMTLFAERDFNG